MKLCSKCGDLKDFSEFHSNGDEIRGQCKPCRNAAKQEKRLPPRETLSSLLEFCDGAQHTLVLALLETGSYKQAAEALGITSSKAGWMIRNIQANAAARGWSPDREQIRPVPEGFHVKGVSTLYGPNGEIKGQWHKTEANKDKQLEHMMAALEDFAEPFRGGYEPGSRPPGGDGDLMNIAILGDPHIGMFAWAQETGDRDFDLQAAESQIVTAVDHLVSIGPPADTFVLCSVGDTFHADTYENRTAASGHALDVDTRWPKVLSVGIRAMRRCIERALQKHAKVRVVISRGNHDPHSSLMLSLCLANYYERDERVEVDTSPSKFQWIRFGSNLIGITHGDTAKPDKLPGIMAADRPQDWGEAQYRYWLSGHIHHLTTKEFPGCIVESFRTLAPRDAWHAAAGYRAGQEMVLDVYHRRWGRVNRHTVGIQRVLAG